MKKSPYMYKSENIAVKLPGDVEAALRFCEGYKAFLDCSKTEREAVKTAVSMAEERGYRPFVRGEQHRPGDRVYYNNRGKSVIFFTCGRKPLEEGVRFNIAHVDSPRLDLKPEPLYEDAELALFKTHYYGGIRKYQWPTIPLSMHGVVCFKDGTKTEVCIGEKEEDPKFFISDLLPHLGKAQGERTLADGIRGEELNIIAGSIPVPEEDMEEPFRCRVLEYLHGALGMEEADFMRAEIEFVPAAKSADIGFDRVLTGAYGQDDRVCAYAALQAAFAAADPEYGTVTVFTDKEEIGSAGNTGMTSRYLNDFLEDLCEEQGARLRDLFRKSLCISSDVGAAYDPSFPDVFEKRNSPFLGHGPVVTKYTGARGKSGANDASAETLAWITACLDRAGVVWQTGELGKVDAGGGGTIAQFMAMNDVDTIDFGVPVLAMHAPFEVTSKLDVYHTYLAYKAVFEAE